MPMLLLSYIGKLEKASPQIASASRSCFLHINRALEDHLPASFCINYVQFYMNSSVTTQLRKVNFIAKVPFHVVKSWLWQTFILTSSCHRSIRHTITGFKSFTMSSHMYSSETQCSRIVLDYPSIWNFAVSLRSYSVTPFNFSFFSPEEDGDTYMCTVPQLVPFSVGVLVNTADRANSR